jgi:tRNA(adenine34) deaminase
MDDYYFMGEALVEAERAFLNGEVPVGCVIVKDGGIIARGMNERAQRKNSLFHAEMTAINRACEYIGDWRLESCRLYVTVEPCPMCAGAIIQARVPVVVYGAPNPKAGCAGSILNILDEPRFNHRAEIIRGIRENECSALMTRFFERFRSGPGS